MIKKLGLQIKMVLAIFCILLLIMIAFLGLSKKVVTDMTEEKLQAQSALQAGKINAWTAELFSELKVYEDTINDFDFGDDEALLTYLESSYERNPVYPAGLYMGDDTGKYFDGSGWVPGDDWVLVERDWYIDGLDNEEFAFGEPYYDSQTGDMCVSASVRMDYTGAKRVLAIDVYVNSVVDMVREISADDTLECFLVTSGSHMVVAHPENEMMAVTLGAEGQLIHLPAGNHRGGRQGPAVQIQGAPLWQRGDRHRGNPGVHRPVKILLRKGDVGAGQTAFGQAEPVGQNVQGGRKPSRRRNGQGKAEAERQQQRGLPDERMGIAHGKLPP